MAILESVNLGAERPKRHKPTGTTGIDKRAVDGPVEVRAPGPTKGVSGAVGDFIGSAKHHGGDDQALYAVQREDLDRWMTRLDRDLPNGFFGENLTTRGLDVNDARLGEIWRIGDTVEVQVTSPRIPCNTFRGWVGEKGWLRTFTLDARPGAYLRILTPGVIAAGDPVTIIHRPDHDVTISLAYRAITTERELLPRLLEAGDDLHWELREAAQGPAPARD
jgi:MOSC domain-containing protein YiiM